MRADDTPRAERRWHMGSYCLLESDITLLGLKGAKPGWYRLVIEPGWPVGEREDGPGVTVGPPVRAKASPRRTKS